MAFRESNVASEKKKTSRKKAESKNKAIKKEIEDNKKNVTKQKTSKKKKSKRASKKKRRGKKMKNIDQKQEKKDEEKEHVYSNNMRRNKFTNANALPQGNDPQWQNEMGNLQNRGPIANWEGVNNGLGFPPDPSGAAGPNHYVQMVNSRIQIFDKQGNTLYGPNALSSILSSNNGDPIVMYDKYADRWFLSGFGQGNSLSFAMSNTADPTGTYTVWNYSLSSLKTAGGKMGCNEFVFQKKF